MKYLFLTILLFTIRSAWAQTPVDTTEVLLVGGIKQFITIKGKDTSNPLLLFLHGGPGGSVMAYADKFTSRLQEKFIVVQWDQRETGKTLQLNASPVPLTLSLFENDTHDVIEQLLYKFGKPKLYLAGHSWGTVLGFYIAGHYPDLLYAYIPISPMVDQLESERIVLGKMKEKAQNAGNKVAREELAKIRIPFESGEQLYYQRKWLFDFDGHVNKKITRDYVVSWSGTWLPLWNEACKINLNESLSVVRCPVYFLVGRKDYQTNSAITARYYENLTAPGKGLFWFEHSAHAIPSSEPALLQAIIIEKIYPQTFPED